MIDGNTILVVVPARGGSKGVKLKNLRPLNGVPLVSLVGQVVRQLPYVDRAVVSTDHPEIAAAAVASGLEAPFLRPDSLAGDRIADWDVLHHVLMICEEMDSCRYDVIVMLQPTSPSRRPEQVTATVQKLITGGYDAVWTVSETDSKAHPLKQLVILEDRLSYYDPAGATIIARQQLTPVYHRNGIAYAISRDCLVNKRSIMGEQTSFVLVDGPVINIDTELDFQFAEFLLRQAGSHD
ncbi:MAG: acylneuraminate cytidylyltransferase family protein [Deltaproteobacteria bacterium]|nr:acylneuraminate cytidylyltransferase family protein [Candidatus Anaeroferrophillus wilburensis]MBN2889685.1 acylneuraminate cytidylyltransferase family protein [Deltaproteobacteria bacterium]